MYKVKLQGEKDKEFPFFKDGNMHGSTFVDRQIASLQAGVVEFEF